MALFQVRSHKQHGGPVTLFVIYQKKFRPRNSHVSGLLSAKPQVQATTPETLSSLESVEQDLTQTQKT